MLHAILLSQILRNASTNKITDRHRRDHRIHPARTREHTRIGHIQPFGAPDLPTGIHYASSLTRRHPAGAHLVRRAEIRLQGRQAAFPERLEPGLEAWFVDAQIVGVVVGAVEDGDAVMAQPDLLGALDVGDLGGGNGALEDVVAVEIAEGVCHPGGSIDRIRVHAPGVPVAGERDVAGHPRHLCGQGLDFRAALPGAEGEEPARDHSHAFQLDAVAKSVEVLELVAHFGEVAAFPGVEARAVWIVPANDGDGVEVEVAADVGVLELGAKEEQGGLDCAGGDDDAFGFDDDGAGGLVGAGNAAVAITGDPGALDTSGGLLAIELFEDDLIGLEAFDELGTGPRSIWEERDHRTLLLGSAAPHRTIAAVMGVASRILRNIPVAKAQFSGTLVKDLVVRIMVDVFR